MCNLSETHNMQINMACIIVQAGCNIERGGLQSMSTKPEVVSGVTIMLEGGYTGGVKI